MWMFSRDQVLAMAPDAVSAKAGLSQAGSSRWSAAGHDEHLVWGECKGSGQSPYRTAAALADGASRCSCPSRKVPCKHALGLLLRHAGGEVPAGAAPAWAVDWLATRLARAAHAKPSGPADPQAAQRRAASRDKKVGAGVEEMRRWLADLARGGLGAAQAQPWTWWDSQARRMIDAQARGLAGHVRKMAAIAATAGQRPDWPDLLTDQVGSAYLLCEAWRRQSELPPQTARALRVRLGFSVPAEQVSSAGERITDRWAVLGQRVSDDGSLRTLQQWLYGERSGEIVTYLAFAAGTLPLTPGLPPGRRTAATVALYPGTAPARVLIIEREDRGAPLGPLPGAATWDEAMDLIAGYLAADPWAELVPVSVKNVTVLPGSEPWLLRDDQGRAMPVAAPASVCWALLAMSGGHRVDVAGEWDGFAFTPQAAAPAGQPGRLLR